VRHRADQMLEEKKFFEVLLLDHLGKITEGSRSNVFFVAGNKLVTSPSNKVLLGITRQKTIQLAAELNIEVLEREVNFRELKAFEAAFLTGTSPKILPVAKIDAFKFDPKNEIVKQLMDSYQLMIDNYIQENKEKQG
jgi:branched-chain amino acid aminotransferase